MNIPSQKEIEIPFLDYLKSKKTAFLNEIIDYLTKHYNLTEDITDLRYPVTGAKIFENRVRFARANLILKGLIKKGQNKGEIVLVNSLDTTELSGDKNENYSSFSLENLEEEYKKFRIQLKKDLLLLIMQKPPEFLESLILKLLKEIGYGSGLSNLESLHRTGKSGDDGIDGFIKQDKLGFETIYVQAKRWSSTVGDSELRNFSGSLDGIKANKGLFITTSSFSKSAIEYAEGLNSKKIILLDGNKLTDLMIDFNLGVSHQANFELKKIDIDFFNQEEI
jgi:restriction system protein